MTPEDRMFPLQDGPLIPWRIIAIHERQAKANHDQTLERLAERGGLSVREAYYVLRDEKWPWGESFIDRKTATDYIKQCVDADKQAEIDTLRAALAESEAKREELQKTLEDLKHDMTDTFVCGSPPALVARRYIGKIEQALKPAEKGGSHERNRS